jgi:site-specific recombinase XerD
VADRVAAELERHFGRSAGLRELRFHDLRHTYGTLMAAAGTPLRTLQGWMGHRDHKTTEIDADFAPDPSQGAVWASAHSEARRTSPKTRRHRGGCGEPACPRA